jgi:RNA-binding protein
MDEPTFTGGQKSHLRGLGQHLEASLKLGKAGLTPAFFEELQRQLHARELVKLRFLGVDRDERATLCVRIASEAGASAWEPWDTPRYFIARTRTRLCAGSLCRNESARLSSAAVSCDPFGLLPVLLPIGVFARNEKPATLSCSGPLEDWRPHGDWLALSQSPCDSCCARPVPLRSTNPGSHRERVVSWTGQDEGDPNAESGTWTETTDLSPSGQRPGASNPVTVDPRIV